jgi:hypothetical protein
MRRRQLRMTVNAMRELRARARHVGIHVSVAPRHVPIAPAPEKQREARTPFERVHRRRLHEKNLLN